MRSERRVFLAAGLLSVGALSLPAKAQTQDKTPGRPDPQNEARDVSLRGRIVCMTEELDKRFNVLPDCGNRHHVYSLRTADGKIHPLLPTDSAAAVWMDERFRQRELQVTARAFPNTNFVEVIRLRSWLNNKLHDLYYYCDVCAITTFKPGPCECCQDPVVFTEKPAEDNPND